MMLAAVWAGAAGLMAAPPAAPTGLVARAGTGVAGLTWNDVSGAARYRVYQSASAGGPFTLVSTEPYNRAVVPNLAAGTAHHFRVTAVNSGNEESTPSAVVSATPDALSIHRPSTAGHFRIGSSFVTDSDRLQRFLQARGLNVASRRYQIIGAGLEYIYNNTLQNNPSALQTEITALQSGSYDALVMNAQRPMLQGERELDGTLLFAWEALAARPNTRVFIHEYWIDDGGGGIDYPWDENGANRARMRQWYWLSSVSMAYEASKILGVPVHVAPIGAAVDAAKDAALRGELAVTNARSGFHTGDAHLNNLGKFVQEGVVAAGAYQIDIRNTHEWVDSSTTLSEADALKLQQITHDTVRATPFSGWKDGSPTNQAAWLEAMRQELSRHEGFEAVPTHASASSGNFTNPRSGLAWSYTGASTVDGFNTPLARPVTRLERKLRLAAGGTLSTTLPRGLSHFSLRLRQVSGGAATLQVKVNSTVRATFSNASTEMWGREVRDLETAPGASLVLTNTGSGVVELDDLIWEEPAVSPSGIAILTDGLVYFAHQQPYSRQLAASGGSGAYAWSVASGSLPPGLSLSSGGLLSGTPTTLGASSFTLRAADAADPAKSAERTYQVSVVAGTAISTEPQGATVQLGDPVEFQVEAVGTSLSYEWFRNGSLLPNSNNPVFRIANTSAADAGTYTVRVTGSGGVATSQPAVLVVDAGDAQVLTTVFNGGNLGLGGNTFDLRNNGTKPIVLTGAMQGNFNAASGLKVSAYWRNGTASGFATSPAGWTLWGTSDAFTGNGYGLATNYHLKNTLTIAPGQTVGIYLLLTSGGSQLAYSSSSTQYTQGNLRLTPILGLGLGTAFSTQTHGPTRLYNGSIEFYEDGTPAVNATAPPAGRIGVAYAHTFTAPGGNGTPAWSLIGVLPAGLSFDAASGSLSGTPRAAGTYALSLTATDLDGDADTRAFNLVIADPYAEWLSANNLPAESAPDQDPHGEGVSLLMRHALGLTSGPGAARQLPRMSFDGDAPLFTFTRNTDATGVVVVVQSSTDLATWTDAHRFTASGNEELTAFVRSRSTTGPGVETIVLQFAPLPSNATRFFTRAVVVPVQ